MLDFDKAIRLTSDNDRKAEIVSRLNDYDNDDLIELFRSAFNRDGTFDFIDVFSADDINDVMRDNSPYEILCSVFFGNVTSVNDYLRFNAYRNLESVSEYELYNECVDSIDEMADWLMSNYYHIDSLYSDDYELLDAWDDIDNDRWDWEEYEEGMRQG